jgi:SAM-dependent methyltransferase
VTYDQAFFDYVNSGALRSARAMLPLLYEVLPVRSVVDVGCGAGAWLAAWRELGITDVLGLDGNYVDQSRLLIPATVFRPVDLAAPFDCARRFDLVQSLEVAEHLPPATSDRFIAALVAHADIVLFSAAPPGQGGDDHVNEQSYESWRCRFAEHGYVCVDYLRPKVANTDGIEPWYRYNTFLFVRSAIVEMLATPLKEAIVPEGTTLTDRSPLLYRCRKAVIRQLPVSVNTLIAKLKERAVTRWRNPSAGTAR